MLDGTRTILEAVPVDWFLRKGSSLSMNTMSSYQASMHTIIFRKDYSYATAVASRPEVCKQKREETVILIGDV